MCRFIHFVNSRFPKYRSRAALESVEAQVFVPISVDEEDKYRAAFRKMVAEYRSAKAPALKSSLAQRIAPCFSAYTITPTMLISLVALVPLIAAATTQPSAACAKPAVRREWRELTAAEQTNYIDAVLCLKSQKSKLPRSAKSPSRFDDVAYTHMMALDVAHSSALFLPWHRAYLAAYESILQSECGYKGTLPYWDWTVDSQAPEKSVLWSSKAFGGDGDPSSTNLCIRSGPFKAWRSAFARRMCLARSFGGGSLDSTAVLYSPEAIYMLLSRSTTYDDFRSALEEGPHNNVHSAIGGDMALIDMSANDPVFMLHHANVDRMWALWQKMHPALAGSYGGDNADGTAADAGDVISLFNLIPSQPKRPVSAMLNTTGGAPLCYVYSNSVRAGIGAGGTANARRAAAEAAGDAITAEAARLARHAEPYELDAARGGAATPAQGDRGDGARLRCATRVAGHIAAQMRVGGAAFERARAREDAQCRFVHFVNAQFAGHRSHAALGRAGRAPAAVSAAAAAADAAAYEALAAAFERAQCG
nr:hypothetical protein HK105_001460 [Polyrhizophydium stewartii]